MWSCAWVGVCALIHWGLNVFSFLVQFLIQPSTYLQRLKARISPKLLDCFEESFKLYQIIHKIATCRHDPALVCMP